MTRALLLLAALVLLAPAATADPAPYVVGGNPATEPYPFAASLQTSGGAHFCGGALIRPTWVATAKHCVAGRSTSSFSARVGSVNRASGGTLAQIARIVQHPTSDLALLQLRAAVTHPPVAVAASVPIGSTVRLLGWGLTCDQCSPGPQVLHEVDAPVVPDAQCGAGPADFCVGGSGRGACLGDDGAPAVQRVGTAWRLAGVASRGDSGTCRGRPWIFVDVAAHRTWIDGHTG